MRWRYLLFPFALLYGAAAALRRWLYRSGICKSYRSAIPTILVGNLRVGGTGKTPHTEYVLNLLGDSGQNALVSRGYGRQTKGCLLVNDLPKDKQTALHIGDEPMQIWEKFPHIQIAVSEKRATALQALEQMTPPIQTVLLDDAYQHLGIEAGLKILLTEYGDPYYDDLPLPAGNLREFASASKFADIVIVTKTPPNLSQESADRIQQKLKLSKNQSLFYSYYIYNKLESKKQKRKEEDITKSTNVLLVTGIAKSRPIVEYLSEQFAVVKHLEYRDHHNYDQKDRDKIKKIYEELGDDTIIVTTEKDYVRLRASAFSEEMEQLPVFVLPISVAFLFDGKDKFDKIIKEHVGKNRKNCELLK